MPRMRKFKMLVNRQRKEEMTRRRGKKPKVQKIPLLKSPKPETEAYIPRTPSPKTEGQATLLDAINKSIVTVCIGAAGTGKTHLAIGSAVQMFRAGVVDRIAISRPLVGADEDAGALPGDKDEKIAPYLQPLFDELEYYASKSEIATWKNSQKLIIAPLQYMRGRTFKKTFLILDEAQNASNRQLKMIVSRLGWGGRLVINGDTTQCDLPKWQRGGLQFLADRLVRMEDRGVRVVHLQKRDIVRHPLIGDILERIEDIDANL